MNERINQSINQRTKCRETKLFKIFLIPIFGEKKKVFINSILNIDVVSETLCLTDLKATASFPAVWHHEDQARLGCIRECYRPF